MKPWTQAQMQKLIDLEIVLILIAVGVDILIEAISSRDWIAAAVIIAGFCMIFGLYWHTLYLDSLFADMREGVGHIFHHAPVASPAPARAPDLPAIEIADRPIIHVSNFLLSKNFYTQALGALGYTVTMDLPALSMASLGIGTSSDMWIKGDGADAKIRASFSARERHMVDDFFDAALDAGAEAAEQPGLRPERGASAYAAAVLDPDGYVIEAFYESAASASSRIHRS